MNFLSDKIGPALGLSLQLPEDLRQRNISMSIGYDFLNSTWEAIVKYHGNLTQIARNLGINAEILTERYAIVTFGTEKITPLLAYNEIEFMEKPKPVSMALDFSLNQSCITAVQSLPPYQLTGIGTIIGIIDSGIDYAHPDFINEDGTSRILSIWDQTISGHPPEGFHLGTEYTNDMINEALKIQDINHRMNVLPHHDFHNHGTHVAGIAAGNGRASQGKYKGVAPEAAIIAVKLGMVSRTSLTKTTEIMRAMKYIIEKAEKLNMPVAVNLSYGTNEGAHNGTSLFDTFIDDMSRKWKTVICVATGNEGGAGRHKSGVLQETGTEDIEFVVSGGLNSLTFEIWKSYIDKFDGMEVGFMTAHEIACSEDYIDLIIEYTNEIENMVEADNGIYSFHWFGGEHRLLHIHKDKLQNFLEQMTGRIKYEFPSPMGILDELGLTESGIEYIHNQPYLRIRGFGVVIAIIDTGIDYTHPAFIYPDNTTKILKIWDQTIEGTPPYGFQLGHEYTSEDINRALQSNEPRCIVEHEDDDGHGTFIAGIAVGYDERAGFTGVAPEAELIIVKVKPAKRNFKEHWMILKEDTKVYKSTDALLGMRYVAQEVNRFMNKPLVINVAMGKNNGPDDTGVSGTAMEDFSHRRGVVIVGAAGNEGIAGHHVSGVVPEHAKYTDIELKVGDREKGLSMEIWIPSPDIMSVLIRSPMNEYVEMLPKKFISKETSKLLFEKTEITIEYDLVNAHNGDQLILIKFRDPTPGIWTITLRSHVYLHGIFNAWLPLKIWTERDTYFLSPDPNYTVTMPGTFSTLISVGAYNHRDGSLHIDSGRGPSRTGNIRPDIVAPGVNLGAPWPNNGYVAFSGTSAAAAMVAGSAALLLEWGIVRKNDPSMNTFKARNYLIGGAKREKNIIYPNNTWGYGKLDVFGAFNMMKL